MSSNIEIFYLSKMFRISFYIFIFGAVAAASVMESLNEVKCATDEFRGVGIAQSENDAFAQARAMIAAQIKSSVSYKAQSSAEQRMLNGNESLKTTNTMQTEQKSNLLNAQDAKIKQSVVNDGSFGVVACMSRANAAKPYIARQNQIADSLSMLAKASPAQKNPKQKKAIWQKTSAFYNEYKDNERVLQSLGMAEEKDNISGYYEAVKTDYQNFCSSQEIYWKNTDDYASKILLSKFSGDFLINVGECESGLRISLEDAGMQCEYKATLGNHLCIFRPFLKGESCKGEIFFQIQLNPALHFTSKTARAAEIQLEAKIRNNDFDQWKQEVKKWVSACVE